MSKVGARITTGEAVRGIKAAAPEDRARLLGSLRVELSDGFRARLMRDRSFRTRLAQAVGRMPDSEYLKYVGGLSDPDLASTIVVQIPAYRDGELLKTIESARAQAAARVDPGRRRRRA